MKTVTYFNGDHLRAEMEFPADTNVWVMIRKTLASFSEEELKAVSKIDVYENSVLKPIYVCGPF